MVNWTRRPISSTETLPTLQTSSVQNNHRATRCKIAMGQLIEYSKKHFGGINGIEQDVGLLKKTARKRHDRQV